jgi:hypothetical protein
METVKTIIPIITATAAKTANILKNPITKDIAPQIKNSGRNIKNNPSNFLNLVVIYFKVIPLLECDFYSFYSKVYRVHHPMLTQSRQSNFDTIFWLFVGY